MASMVRLSSNSSVIVVLPAVFTDVKMCVKPAIGRQKRGDIPAAASEIGRKHAPAGHAAYRGNRAADQNVVLVAMHDVGFQNLPGDCERERIGPLAAHVPRTAQHFHVEVAFADLHRLRSE